MRVFRDTVFILLGVFIAVVVFLHVLVDIKGKALLTNELKAVFKNQEVTIESVKATFPFNLIVKNLAVGDFFQVKEASASGGAIDIFNNNFSISELRLQGLTLHIEGTLMPPELSCPIDNKTQAAAQAEGAPPGKSSAEILVTDRTFTKLPEIVLPPVKNTLSYPKEKFLVIRNILLKHLNASDSTIYFTERNIGEKGLIITVKDASLDLQNLVYPLKNSAITVFTFSGKIPSGEKISGKIKIDGWCNFFKKDMQALVKIDDMDGLILYPYYSKWVNLEDSRIQKAKLFFNSDIYALNNDVTANCHLELKEVSFKPRTAAEEPKKSEKVCQFVIDALKAMNDGKIILDFAVKTKMNSPQVGFGDVKIAFEDKLQHARKEEVLSRGGVLRLPGKIIEGTVLSATEVSKALITGTFTAGKEFKKAIEDSFTKEVPAGKKQGSEEKGASEKPEVSPVHDSAKN